MVPNVLCSRLLVGRASGGRAACGAGQRPWAAGLRPAAALSHAARRPERVWELKLDTLGHVKVEQIGGAQAALDMANAYAQQRYAFGRAIGSYQGIKHKLADMYIKLTLAKSNSYYAAWALSTDSSELPLAAATARVSATEAFNFCAQENIQTHGGNGYTWEYDCHLFYRRAKLLSVTIGSLANWQEKLLKELEKSYCDQIS